MTVKAGRRTYKGRRLLVKRGREWGKLEAFVNGVSVGHPYGSTQAAVERELDQLERNVDFADGRPGAFGPEWYQGATE